ncbi:MAG: hypothetical protein ABW252_17525 [Polyangiales bacterium]
MMRGLRALALVLACWLAHGAARADVRAEVVVRVLEIAGGKAYLSAGTSAGLRVGSRVHFGATERRVERATGSFAVVSARRLRVGDRGVARKAGAESEAARLPPPRPLAAFVDQWPAAQKPSARQRPRPVPLGSPVAVGRTVDASLTASGSALVPLDGETDAVGRAELRARVLARPVERFPLELAADVGVQRWLGRYASGVATGDPRPLLRVRELRVSLGEADGFRAELGRLRYAAASLGPLDGGRFEAARIGPVRIAGFGGLLPEPIDGRFARNAGRFGAEVAVRDEDHALRPELTLVASGSVFDGRIDERRLYAQGALWPGDHRIGSYAELSRFDADNPWKRPTLDLTGAGVDFDLRFARARLGGRFDARKPERSYWLARTFPDTWLCGTSRVDVRCAGGDDTRYVAQGWGGVSLGSAELDAGGSWAGSSDARLGQHALGYATLRLPRIGRYDLAIGGSHEGGSLLRASTAGRADVGASFVDERVHLSVYYRPARKTYLASLDGIWEHGAGASLHVMPTDALTLDLYGDLRMGDVDAAVVMLSVMYRLRQ